MDGYRLLGIAIIALIVHPQTLMSGVFGKQITLDMM